MKYRLIIYAFIACMAFSFKANAQTYFYKYEYSIEANGAKFDDNRIYKSKRNQIMTFTNNKSYVAETNENGVSINKTGYNYSYSESGFSVYTPGSAGARTQVDDMAEAMANSAFDATYGWHVIGVSFGNNYNTMLIHQSNGVNQVFKRTSNPKKPNIRY